MLLTNCADCRQTIMYPWHDVHWSINWFWHGATRPVYCPSCAEAKIKQQKKESGVPFVLTLHKHEYHEVYARA